MKINWSNVVFIKSSTNKTNYPQINYPEFLFLGKSNVGKSTLINTILNNRKIAKTSQKPGKTTLLNFFVVDEKFTIVDAPGYGYAKLPKKVKATFLNLINEYIKTRKQLNLVFFLLDSRRNPSDDDLIMLQNLLSHDINVLVVTTKFDKLNQKLKHQLIKNLKLRLNLQKDDFISVSSFSNYNIFLVKEIINKSIN